MSEMFTQELIERLGWTLLHFLWQGLVIAIVLAVLLRVLKKASANCRYIVGCIALMVMVVAPVATFFQLANQQVSLSAEVFQPRVEIIPLPLSPRTKPAQTVSEIKQSINEITPTLSFVERLNQLLPFLVVGWAMGVAILSLRLSLGWLRVKRLKRIGVESIEEAWHRSLAELVRRLHIKQSVRLVKSVAVEVPTVIGWLRPIILMPAGCLAGLSPAQVEYILAHELAHVRRHDYLVNLAQCLAETILFYHPAVWWVSKRIREEREHCCDDIAVSVCGDRLEYARTLAALEELRGSHDQLVMAAAGAPLLSRIRRLLGQSEKHPGHSAWPMAGIVVLVMVALLTIGLRSSRAVADQTQGTIRGTNRPITLTSLTNNSSRQIKAYEENLPQIHFESHFFEVDEKEFPKAIFNLPGTSNALSATCTPLQVTSESMSHCFTGMLTEPQYRAAVKTLRTAGNTDSLIAPSVTTESGRQAQIQAVDIIDVLTNASPNVPKMQLPFGPVLDLIPAVTPDKFGVQLKTIATVTRLLDAPTVVLPRINLTQLTADTTVEDCQTLVLGGLMPETITKMKDKVPVLGDLPLVGRLFRSETILENRKYLIVFVTPILINSDGSRYHSDQAIANREQVRENRGEPQLTHPRLQQLPPPHYMASSDLLNLSKSQKEILSKLSRVQANLADYNGLTLGEVINNLSEISRKHDLDKKGINFFINREASTAARVPGGVDPTNNPVTTVLKMPLFQTNVTLTAVLDCIATNNSLQYTIEDYAVVFSLKGPERPPPLFWKSYKLNLEAFNRQLHLFSPEYNGTNASTLTNFLINFFQTNGIDFSLTKPANVGKSLSFNERKGTLAVHTTRRDLDLIGKLLQKISTEPSQSQTNTHGVKLDERTGKTPDSVKLGGSSVTSAISTADSLPQGVATLLDDGKQLFETGKMDAAEEKFLETLALETNNLAAGYYLKLIKEWREYPRENRGGPKITYPPLQEQQLPPPHFIASTNLSKTGEARQEIVSKLARTQAKPLDYNGLTLLDAVAKLNRTIGLGDTGSNGIAFHINRVMPAELPIPAAVHPYSGLPSYLARENGDPAAMVLKLPLVKTNIVLTAFLDCIATNNSLQYAIEDHGVIFNFKSPDQKKLYSKTFKLGPEVLSQMFPSPDPTIGSTNDAARSSIINFFEAHGINFPPINPANAGKSMFIKDRKGLMLVHATQEDLDLIEKVLININTVPAHIQTNIHRIKQDETTGKTPNAQTEEKIFTPALSQNSLKPGAQDQFFSRTYRVSKTHFKESITHCLEILATNRNSVITFAGASENSNSTVATNANREFQLSIRKFFQAAGADFSPSNPSNVGKSIFYNETKGLLLVRSTRGDLDVIEKALVVINTLSPQIHLKTRFVEMDETVAAKLKFDELVKTRGITTNFNLPEIIINNQSSSAAPEVTVKNQPSGTTAPTTNSLISQFTGFLTPERAAEILAQLEKAEGVDMLTLPDITTENGQQAQFQSVEIQTIVTGLTTVWTNGTSTNVYSTQTLPFGPVLDVIPKLLADNTIDMTMIASVTEFLGYDDPSKLEGGKRTDVQIPLPKFKLRQLTSNVTVTNGQTIILGGKEHVELVKPADGKQKQSKSLLIFITPTLVDPDYSPHYRTLEL